MRLSLWQDNSNRWQYHCPSGLMSEGYISDVPRLLLPTDFRNRNGLSCIGHSGKSSYGGDWGTGTFHLWPTTYFLEEIRGWCLDSPPGWTDPEFYDHLNSINSDIQFTLETESDNILPYLDVLLHHCDDGGISTSVFKKPTHTNKYLDLSSHHPLLQKIWAIKTLFTRACNL